MARRRDPYRINTGIHIEWFTVRSSTVFALGALALGLAAYLMTKRPPAAPPTENSSPAPVDRTAHFINWKGTVDVRKADRFEWTPASDEMSLESGDTIRTGSGAEARVLLFDGTVYTVRALSILVIEEAHPRPGAALEQTRVCVASGMIDVHTPAGSSLGMHLRRQICTPILEASLRENAQATVGHDREANVSRVEAPRGGIDVTANGMDVEVLEGQGILVSPGKAPEEFKLPSVPVIVSPAHLTSLGFPATVEFRWRPVAEARRYRILLDRSAQFVDPVFDAMVSSTSYLQGGLEPGTYHWQVSAVDGEDRRSSPARATFTVRRTEAPPPPRLTADTPSVTSVGLVTGNGRTDPGALVTVDYGLGSERVQVRADGTFTYYFQVREAGRHLVIVRARNEDGGEAEKTVYAEAGTSSGGNH
ncbi:MAG TPA: hypothetical protein VLK65_29440 [Vicinamibacteria bacterium]|nr:hypothetical protein [Vicinamibacteria bacterium]